jgi:hypothetical protein
MTRALLGIVLSFTLVTQSYNGVVSVQTGLDEATCNQIAESLRFKLPEAALATSYAIQLPPNWNDKIVCLDSDKQQSFHGIK